MLEVYDDIATDILIDHVGTLHFWNLKCLTCLFKVYYWTTIRKNHDMYTSYKNISSEEITAILQNALQPMHHEERVLKAVLDLIGLLGLQGFWGNLNADEQKHFQQHLCMYVKIYILDCPFEISSTNQYTSKLHEATVTA